MGLRRTGDTGLPVDPRLNRPAPPRRAGGRRGGGGLRSRLRLGVLAAIAAGGALGAAARYLVGQALPPGRTGFPWATFAVNVSGSLVLAVLLVFVLEIWPPTRYVRPFAAIGFFGAYTTFSTWMVETDELVARGRPEVAAGYVAASLLAGLAAVSLGLVLGRAVLARRSRTGAPAPAPARGHQNAHTAVR
jgi:CrcB protein